MTLDKVTLGFGAVCDPISVQLEQQGIEIDEHAAARFQKMSDAINMVCLHRLVPESKCNEARKKLMNKIMEHLKETRR